MYVHILYTYEHVLYLHICIENAKKIAYACTCMHTYLCIYVAVIEATGIIGLMRRCYIPSARTIEVLLMFILYTDMYVCTSVVIYVCTWMYNTIHVHYLHISS